MVRVPLVVFGEKGLGGESMRVRFLLFRKIFFPFLLGRAESVNSTIPSTAPRVPGEEENKITDDRRTHITSSVPKPPMPLFSSDALSHASFLLKLRPT